MKLIDPVIEFKIVFWSSDNFRRIGFLILIFRLKMWIQFLKGKDYKREPN